MLRTGLDRLVASPELRALASGKRFALLAHPASVTHDLVHVREALARSQLSPAIVFGPEHGYGGEAQDMIGVDDARDVHGTPIRSLYGESFDDLSPQPRDLEGLDVLLIDLQDVGARYYTFVWTALLVLRAARKQGVRVVVLDRPNPIGARDEDIEGAVQDVRYRSFVGLEPLPIRHGLTLGEVVALFAAREGVTQDELVVVRHEGLARDAHAVAWGRPFVPPSPNMPTYETALVYPGACLVEGTNLSEGRGTTRPFELVGAPWLDGERLARELRALGLPGFVARPVTFLPMFQKHARTLCGGVFVHVTDAARFRPVATYAALVALAAQQGEKHFAFRTERYEFVDDIPAFDLLVGGCEAREAIVRREEPARIAALVADVAPRDIDVVHEGRRALERYAR